MANVDNKYGLITDVINYKWNFNLCKSADESVVDWHTRILEYVIRFCDEPDTLSNEYLYPEYTLEYVPLEWKYKYCEYPDSHTHSQCKSIHDRQLWLNCTNLQPYASNLIQTIIVTDQCKIWSLCVDGVMLFPDPNIHSLNQIPSKADVWEWNIIINHHNAMSPFTNRLLIQLFRVLKDPYDLIWVGRQNFRDANVSQIVVPFQFNSDAFEYIKTSSSKIGKKSTKQNFVCPMNHMLSTNMLCSMGVVISGMNNKPFYTMFAKEFLHSIFRGHKIYIEDLQKEIILFPYICGFLNDGDEVRIATGSVGASGNRPDSFTVLNKHSPLSDMYFQPVRHHKIMITQSVKFKIV